MKTIIIQGSSRSKGNSSKIVELIKKGIQADVLDLKTKTIHPFTYDHAHMDDDFLPTMNLLLNYDLMVFVTPVYWYSMSGIMKNFFDRITDCLQIEKDIGRKLRGKNMAAISCGSESSQVEGFFIPFRESAGYLGMNYQGDLHTWIEDKHPSQMVINNLQTFIQQNLTIT